MHQNTIEERNLIGAILLIFCNSFFAYLDVVNGDPKQVSFLFLFLLGCLVVDRK